MRPPLSLGTVLQTRYRLLSILGQGGFGRTYLAEDQGRFSELCAIKELILPQGDAYALAKSKELFQREAQILYQIQHPQIPQFRANFEQDQRLFLVQDYVEGQTYRKLLDQRKAQGYSFSESEVLQLLQRILPVLAHIHAKGIIHRDIAPDNIMLREKDNLPVLIDFGVVKELATQFQTGMIGAETLQQGRTAPQNTTVGKLGYAPSEQIQTGRAYPCSDLYSLAVTAVVLLSGREPQELFDDNTLTWYWQRWANTSPELAQVLNRMLSVRPGDRYQSVSEVVQALQQTQATAASYPAPPAYPQPDPAAPLPVSAPVQPTANPTPAPSELRTVAVGQPNARELTTASYQRGEPTIPQPRSSVWDDPLAVTMVGLSLVVLTGLGSWALVRSVLTNQTTPAPIETVVTSPILTPSPAASISPKPRPTPTTSPAPFTKRLQLTPGEPQVESGKLATNQTAVYTLRGKQGQELSAILNTEGVLMTIKGPNQNTLAQRVQSWQDTLPATGRYTFTISPVKGIQQSNYEIEFILNNGAVPSPSPSPTEPAPEPTEPTQPTEPTVETQSVNFPPGTGLTTLSDRTTPLVIKRYLVQAEAGQVISARVGRGAVSLTVNDPNGRQIPNVSNVRYWQEEAIAGEYQIDVIARRESNYVLEIGLDAGSQNR